MRAANIAEKMAFNRIVYAAPTGLVNLFALYEIFGPKFVVKFKIKNT
jgi:hypothetical protein